MAVVSSCGDVAVSGVSTVVQLFKEKSCITALFNSDVGMEVFLWFRDARTSRALWQRRLRARPNKIASEVGYTARTKRTDTWNNARSYILPAVPDR